MLEPVTLRRRYSDTYVRNLGALRKTHPELADELGQVSTTDGVPVGPRPGGLPNIPLRIPGRPWYYQDNSSVDAAAAELAGLDSSVARIAVFLGFGLGYQLVHFATAHAERLHTERIIVIEKSLERFKLALQTTELGGLMSDPRIVFLVGLDHDGLFAKAFNLLRMPAFISRLSTLAPFYHSGDLAEEGDYYVAALRQIREAATEAAHLVGNSPEDSLIGLRNMLSNLRVIAESPGINLLQNAFAEHPAIIVSTGPSLNKNIDQLRPLQHRALILAVDASVAPLAAAGVKPHLVVSLERVPEVVRLVKGFDLRDSYFAACPVVRPEVYEAYNGPKLIVYRNLAHFDWLELDRGTLSTGPSAANMAFRIAEYLGADPIVLIGQDLAFGETGATHAQHAVLGHNQATFHRQPIYEVPGNLGGMVKTSEVWMRFLKNFRADVHAFQGTCINATEGGALIPGTKVMPLRDAAERFMKHSFDARTMIRRRLEAFECDSATGEHLANKVRGGIHEVEEIIEHCQRGAGKAHEFIETHAHLLTAKRPPTRTVRRTVKRQVTELFRLRKQVEEMHPRAYRLLMGLTLQPYLITFEQRVAQLRGRFSDTTLEQTAWGSMHLEWFVRVSELSRLCLRELQNVWIDELRSIAASDP